MQKHAQGEWLEDVLPGGSARQSSPRQSTITSGTTSESFGEVMLQVGSSRTASNACGAPAYWQRVDRRACCLFAVVAVVIERKRLSATGACSRAQLKSSSTRRFRRRRERAARSVSIGPPTKFLQQQGRKTTRDFQAT